jgi:hypothetical protein|tara:strand:+ start:357 stop:590 length:234 start_codon:yes stop_codon:yes gene_type:complete
MMKVGDLCYLVDYDHDKPSVGLVVKTNTRFYQPHEDNLRRKEYTTYEVFYNGHTQYIGAGRVYSSREEAQEMMDCPF